MKANKQPKRHHFIPQCYLKQFTASGDNIFVLPKDERHMFKARTKSLAVRNHYYSYKDEFGDLNADIEKSLSNIEGTSATILDKIIKQENLTPDDKKNFSIFLGIMFSRNPNWRDGVEQGLKHLIEKVRLAMVNNDKDYEKLTEGMPEFLKAIYPSKEEMMNHLVNDYKIHIKPIASLSYIHMGLEISKYLLEMHWRFWIKRGRDLPLFTSDNPCYITNKSIEKTPYGAGIALAGSILYFPVSPEIILSADWSGSKIEYKLVTSNKAITRFNSRTVRYAEKEVYSNSTKDKLIKIFKNNKGYSFKALIDEVGPYQIFRKKLTKK